MSTPDFLLTNLELRASNPDGTEGEGLSHKTGGIGGGTQTGERFAACEARHRREYTSAIRESQRATGSIGA